MALKGQAKKDWQRGYMRKRRLNPDIRRKEREAERIRNRTNGQKECQPCEICGFSETTDVHHEGAGRRVYVLCPNHHALITRGIKTLTELKGSNQEVRPDSKTSSRDPRRIPGLIMDGNRIVGIQSTPQPESIPRYNPAVHRAGDRVLVQRGDKWVSVIVPEIDADGNPI